MNDTTDAAAIFAPLWKRKWMILIVALLVGGASYVYYKRQPSLYAVSTALNLASGSEEQGSLGGAGKAGVVSKSALGNAATIITSSVVAEEAHKLLRAEHANVKGVVRAKTSSTGSDILTISVEASSPKRAARLANAYATAYIQRERAAYLRSVNTLIADTRRQLHRIELASASSAKGKGSKGASAVSSTAVLQEANLSTKLNQLESQLSVQSVQQISPAKAKGAELLQPKPKTNAIFGFAFGIVLAAIAAFLLERFDRSLRSLSAVEGVFSTRILTALPSVRHPIVETDGRRPARSLLEPLRLLDTTLRLRDSTTAEGGAPRVILFTSANAGDGKSTLVAALALVRREAGERVAVIEADFRRPVLARLLGVGDQPGLADVLTGQRAVDEALEMVPVTGAALVADGDADGSAGAGATLVQTRTVGSVSVLVGGTSNGGPPSLTDSAFTDLISSMSNEFDSVLIDAPSPLEASEALPLLGVVDGIVAVARLGHTQDVSAARLAELLALPATAPVLGAVANDVPARELRRSGFTRSPSRRRLRVPTGR